MQRVNFCVEWIRGGGGAHLSFIVIWALSSSLECFLEGPNMRAPPCSSWPLAGAHVGRCAVVIAANEDYERARKIIRGAFAKKN